MLTELYNNTTTYLTQNFGENFILFTVLLTTAVSVIYLFVLNYIISGLDQRHFLRERSLTDDGALSEDIQNTQKQRQSQKKNQSSLDYFVTTIKIVFGLFLLICGLVMLVLPGQGIITILLGLSLLPFPGKQKLEANLLAKPSVRKTLNWLREKANKPPFIFD